MTTWKPIPGYELAYEVSDDGQVRSLERKVPCRNGVRTVPSKVLKPARTVGYPCVVLGRGNTKMVHSLVALAFIGPRPQGADVMHLDGTRTNNSINNLRYGSRAENNRDAFYHGRRKVTPEMLAAARRAIARGVKGKDVALLLGISQSQVSNIKKGRQYAHPDNRL